MFGQKRNIFSFDAFLRSGVDPSAVLSSAIAASYLDVGLNILFPSYFLRNHSVELFLCQLCVDCSGVHSEAFTRDA